MQERTKTHILNKPEVLSTTTNVSVQNHSKETEKETKILKRYHRILIVNETIETYFEASSDDSDSNELSIDESARDAALISENDTLKSPCNTPEINLISSDEDESIVPDKQIADGFRKIASNKWQSEEKSPTHNKFASINLKNDSSLNFKSEDFDSKPNIDTCEITIVNESIKNECSHAVDCKNQTISSSLSVLDSIQKNVKIFEQRFRKIAPKEMPMDANNDNEIWRINPLKSTVKKKKKKVLIKFRRKHIKPKRKKKVRHRMEQIPTIINDEDLAMEVEEYVGPDEHIEVIKPQFESGFNLIPCPYCSYKNPREGGVKKHLIMYHGGFTTCPHCNFQTLSWKIMEKHFVKHLADGIYFTCLPCSETFTRVASMRSHLFALHKNTDPSQCFICEFKAQTPDKFINVMRSLRQHVLDVHLNKTEVLYNCPVCNFQTTLDLEMKSHIYLSHSYLKGTIYQCSECCHISASLTELVYHLDIHRNGIRLTCSLCKFEASNKLRMALHKNTHSERMFKCAYCDSKFKFNFLVKYHILSRHNRKK